MANRSIEDLLAGETRFGRLTFVGEGTPRLRADGAYERRARFLCDCGKSHEVAPAQVRNGTTTSCGCYRVERVRSAGKRRATHGKSKSAPEYYVWCSMKQRCQNPNQKDWADYGGRGIKVCERWRSSFENFYADMGPRPSPKHSIDRIDSDGNYEPGNCQWADDKAQTRNRRCAIEVEINGEKLPLAELAARAGLKYSTVRMRYRKGWPVDRLTEPVS